MSNKSEILAQLIEKITPLIIEKEENVKIILQDMVTFGEIDSFELSINHIKAIKDGAELKIIITDELQQEVMQELKFSFEP